MSKTKSFNLLYERMPPESRAAVERRVQETKLEIQFVKEREIEHLTQEEMDLFLEVKQAAMSQIEKREDMPVGTLRKLINALGGDLELVARFPEGTIVLKGFDKMNTSQS